MKCEQCGRPALALVRTGKKRSRKARVGHPRKIKDHSLCAACWEKQGDSWRTSKAMEELAVAQRTDRVAAVDELERIRKIALVWQGLAEQGKVNAVDVASALALAAQDRILAYAKGAEKAA